MLREGKVKDVPTIVGAARDELAGLDAGGLAAYANLSAEGFRRWLRDQYGVEHVETMLKLYPVSSARVGTEGTHMKTKLLLFVTNYNIPVLGSLVFCIEKKQKHYLMYAQNHNLDSGAILISACTCPKSEMR